jgi:NhaP-type Na+/H+ or K+/H+ antiporter
MYEYCLIFLGGMVHGAVPFALSVTIPLITGDPTSNCTQLNIVSVVLITSLVFNMFIPKIEKVLLSQIREM